MRINELIKGLRGRDNLTQVDLADKLQCNRQKIADWERGKSTPSVEDIVALTEIFNVSADYLLGLAEPDTKDRDLRFVCEYTGLSKEAINSLINTRRYFKNSFAIGNELCEMMDKIIRSDFLTGFTLDVHDYKYEFNKAISKLNKMEQYYKEHDCTDDEPEEFKGYCIQEAEKELYYCLFIALENIKKCIKKYSGEKEFALEDADLKMEAAYCNWLGGQDGDNQETQ